ncbi:hypothetical protein M9H77_03650 [Catharanthus roseus]|uniref:Uncharacterized protein n=1 Tax=Catharanthus roseus TaxID=4058 RepID=A0ACC0CC57_CATRO|nr:hypothetical protein M9H77_03650 [Catharanthus roseus]
MTSALVDMYCNRKQVESGRRSFDDALKRRLGLWNAMLAGYAQNGFYDKALVLFMDMIGDAGLSPNPTTIASVLPACVHSENFAKKEAIHGYIIKLSFSNDRYVQNALMDMYSRIRKINVSEFLFDNMEGEDIISWNTMITGYVVCCYHEDVLRLVQQMQVVERDNEIKEDNEDDLSRCNREPNSITLMTVLPCCAALSALEKGSPCVCSALVDMFAKCGCISLARKIFYGMPTRNDTLSDRSRNRDLKPNEVTFTAIFAACSYSGLDYGIEPIEDHYACIIDLLEPLWRWL